MKRIQGVSGSRHVGLQMALFDNLQIHIAYYKARKLDYKAILWLREMKTELCHIALLA